MATAGRGPYDEAIELVYFAWRKLVGEPDRLLARRGLGRVHHRILYCIASGPGITIGGLCRMLGVSKQALHQPLGALLDAGLVDPTNRRIRRLRLTARGTQLESRLAGQRRDPRRRRSLRRERHGDREPLRLERGIEGLHILEVDAPVLTAVDQEDRAWSSSTWWIALRRSSSSSRCSAHPGIIFDQRSPELDGKLDGLEDRPPRNAAARTGSPGRIASVPSIAPRDPPARWMENITTGES